MHQIALQLGPLTLTWYGIMVACGFLAGFWTAARRAPRAGLSRETVLDFAPWLVLGGIAGGRALYVVSYPEQFAREPVWEIFMVHHGGLVFYGGLVGAALACIIRVLRTRMSLWQVADVFAPSIPLGYCFGRIGCFLNGCCFGKPCSWPWGVQFPNGSFAWNHHQTQALVGATDPSLAVHPVQFYDALTNLLLFFALEWLFRHKKFQGQVFAVYLVCFAVTRSAAEFFRGDYPQTHLHGGITPGQWVSIGILAAGLGLYYTLSRRVQNS